MQTEQIIKEYFKNKYNNEYINVVRTDPNCTTKVSVQATLDKQINENCIDVYLLNDTDETKDYHNEFNMIGIKGLIWGIYSFNSNTDIISPLDDNTTQRIASEISNLKNDIHSSISLESKKKIYRSYFFPEEKREFYVPDGKIHKIDNIHIYYINGSSLIQLT